MLYPNILAVRAGLPRAPSKVVTTPSSFGAVSKPGKERTSPSLLLLGLAERLAISVLLSGVALVGVAMALASE